MQTPLIRETTRHEFVFPSFPPASTVSSNVRPPPFHRPVSDPVVDVEEISDLHVYQLLQSKNMNDRSETRTASNTVTKKAISSPTFVATVEGDIGTNAHPLQVRSLFSLLLVDDLNYCKTLLVGCCSAMITMSVFAIIFVIFEAHYCGDEKTSSYETFDDAGVYYKYYTLNHGLIAFGSSFPVMISAIAAAWFLPSLLCLNQVYWNTIRWTSFIYVSLLSLVVSYLWYPTLSGYGVFITVSWAIILSLFVVFGILYGYPAFRAITPLVYVASLIVITFSVIYTMVFRDLPDSYFTYTYPWYLSAVECVALFFVDGYVAIPRKKTLINKCQCNCCTSNACNWCCWIFCWHEESCLKDKISMQLEEVFDSRLNTATSDISLTRIPGFNNLSLNYNSSSFNEEWECICSCCNCKNRLKLAISKFRNQVQRSLLSNQVMDLDVYNVTQDLYSNQFVFLLVAFVSVVVESYRLCGIIRLSHDLNKVLKQVSFNICSEVISRNNLYYEFIYRLILKKPNPPLTKCYSIYYGVKFKLQYLPGFLVALFNIWDYGPSYYCYQNVLPSNIDFKNSKLGWWLFCIYIIGEFLTDWLSETCLKQLMKFGIIEQNSQAHKIIFVHSYYLETAVIYAALSIAIWNAVLYDCEVRCNYPTPAPTQRPTLAPF